MSAVTVVTQSTPACSASAAIPPVNSRPFDPRRSRVSPVSLGTATKSASPMSIAYST
ncbi:hypothetical protein [Haloarcula litorea]|uniref:hypothetical protein n=1 Tax=Haloarcula litorea TaxID=3032579 RepID=UPI0023E8A712|nr:hypothetical protein [Halomicroarcula sp. GDY20]